MGFGGREEGVTLGSVMYAVNVIYFYEIWINREMQLVLRVSPHAKGGGVKLLLCCFDFFGQNHNAGHPKVIANSALTKKKCL